MAIRWQPSEKMTINYKFDKSDLTEYLKHSLKKNRALKVVAVIFNVLIFFAVLLIRLGIITSQAWFFVLGISFIGLNAWRPNLKKEAIKKVNELERTNKLKDCLGILTLTVTGDELIVRNEDKEERISPDKIIDVQADNKYLTVVLSHGQLFIPLDSVKPVENKKGLLNEIERMRLSAKV
jgi:hypothetical protein